MVFHYPICANSEIVSCEVVAYQKFKTIENFKTSPQKLVAVASERCSLMRGSEYSDLNGVKFGILEKRSLTRGGRTGRFYC